MKLLVDGDIVAYRTASAAEQAINWGDGHWTLHAFEEDVTSAIDGFMASLMERSGATEVVTALSGPKNFRKDVASTYKQNRVDKRKPMALPTARAHLMAEYGGLIVPNIEADDTLGIYGSRDADTVIWSDDKDLKTIPAKHLFEDGIVEIDEKEADYWFFYQTLVGDSTDNYKGCPTIGDKKARAILDKDCSWEAVVAAFEKQGLSEAVALEQARLARILRDGEYDFETNEVRLWEPED